MDAPVRIAFDVSLPVIACEAFTVSGKSFADGDTVPWRDLGVTEVMLHDWWRAGMVRFRPMQQVCNHVLYDAKVAVESPKQRARR